MKTEGVIVDGIINLLNNVEYKIVKKEIIKHLNNHTIFECFDWLSNNRNNSNSIFLLGEFNYLGIATSINKKKAFELFQKAVNLGNTCGIHNLGDCYKELELVLTVKRHLNYFKRLSI